MKTQPWMLTKTKRQPSLTASELCSARGPMTWLHATISNQYLTSFSSTRTHPYYSTASCKWHALETTPTQHTFQICSKYSVWLNANTWTPDLHSNVHPCQHPIPDGWPSPLFGVKQWGFVFCQPRERHWGQAVMLGEDLRGAVGVPNHPKGISVRLRSRICAGHSNCSTPNLENHVTERGDTRIGPFGSSI